MAEENNNTAQEADLQNLTDQVQEDAAAKEENLAAAVAPEVGGSDAGDGNNADSPAPQADAEEKNLDLILDIPLKVSVELGRTKMLVSDLLNLGQGSVVELNKLAGENLEILVNDKIIAKGEAVVVNEKFGVRLTDIISPMERVQQLK